MVSDELLAELQQLNRADKLRVVQLLVNQLAVEERQPIHPPSTIEEALDAMAADPDIQREIELINAEFTAAEGDGLQ